MEKLYDSILVKLKLKINIIIENKDNLKFIKLFSFFHKKNKEIANNVGRRKIVVCLDNEQIKIHNKKTKLSFLRIDLIKNKNDNVKI